MEDLTTKSRKKLIQNINKIKARIEFRQNTYRDNIGALFLLNLCKDGPEQAADFFIRYAAEGYDVELNEFETQALEKAGGTTDMVSRIMDVSIGKNIKNNLMNRRRFMYMTGIGVGGAALLGLRVAARSDEANELKSEGKKEIEAQVDKEANRIIDGARDAQGNIDPKKLTAAMKHYRSEALDYSGTVKNVMLGVGVVGALSVFLASYASSGLEESREKSEQIINDLDGFCKNRLKRREVPTYGAVAPVAEPEEGQARSNSWQRLHDMRQLVVEKARR